MNRAQGVDQSVFLLYMTSKNHLLNLLNSFDSNKIIK